MYHTRSGKPLPCMHVFSVASYHELNILAIFIFYFYYCDDHFTELWLCIFRVDTCLMASSWCHLDYGGWFSVCGTIWCQKNFKDAEREETWSEIIIIRNHSNHISQDKMLKVLDTTAILCQCSYRDNINFYTKQSYFQRSLRNSLGNWQE